MALYHLDTDMGVDDGLALALADKLFPASLAVSTVWGNAPVSVATRNALLFRELLCRSTTLPIFTGADRALDGFSRDTRLTHGEDGLGGATQSLEPGLLEKISGQMLVRLGDSPPPQGTPVTLIGIGPATNIPRIVSWYGHSAIERIILMSGVFFDFGNANPAAEFNAHCDPFALRQTLDLGIPTTLVPLDVCRKVQLSRAAVEPLKNPDRSPLANLIANSHMRYIDAYRVWECLEGCYPHDALTVLAAFQPERFFKLRGEVTIECAPPKRGQTTFKPAASSHIEVATGCELKWTRGILSQFLNTI
jgi:inosine-uridine nucleoside N-ribohydrolase